mgnify:FL=1
MKPISGKLFRAPAALLVALGLTGGQALADIVGSAHDFSNSGFSGGEICVVCHTTHNADTSVTEAPLWNHELTSQTFAMYSSPTMDAAQDAQPTGASKLCLSCHDGATAVDAYGGNTGSIFLSGPAAVGANDDLTDDHPISITYDSALAVTDPGLHDPTQQTVTIGSGNKSRTGLVSELMTPAGKVQCSSCHDVHNTYAVPNGNPLLLLSKSGSEICLACHDK